MKLDRILVAIDGSADSLAAVEWAAGLAALAGAEVVAVHAAGLLEQARSDELRRTLAEAWCEPLLAAGVPTREVVRDGSAVPVILATADEEEVDLLVLGSRGAGSSPVQVLGSTSTRVSQQANRPVVIVPGAAHGRGHGSADEVHLADGRTVLVREARDSDAPRVAALVADDRPGTAAVLLALDGEAVAGIGRYWPLEGTDAADVHVVVAPPYRGSGLGRKLLVLLGVHAFEGHVRRFTASYPADQRAVDALVSGSGLSHRSTSAAGTTEVEIELPGP